MTTPPRVTNPEFGATATRVLETAVGLQQIPAPTFSEHARSSRIRDLFLEARLEDVSLDELGNVYARIGAAAQKKDSWGSTPIVVCAHLDTVFPKETDLAIRRLPGKVFGPGIGDNSLGLASLLGLARLSAHGLLELACDVWLVANVREEGLGNLEGIRAVVARFGGRVRGYVIVEGLALGQVYTRAVGVRRYRVTVRTAGGHAWSDSKQPSAVHELAALTGQWLALDLPAVPRTTLNVGTFHGGTGVNVVAREAACELDLRSEDPAQLELLDGHIHAVVTAANRPEVTVIAEPAGHRPTGSISDRHALVRLAMGCLREQGLEPRLSSGSTDANFPLSLGIPAIVVGISTGGGAHTENEYIETEPIIRGLAQLAALVTGASALPPPDAG